MKRSFLLLALAAGLLHACRQTPSEFSTYTLSERRSYLLTLEGPHDPCFAYDSIGLLASYSLDWPAEGVLARTAEKELRELCFHDLDNGDVKKSASRWIECPFFDYDEEYEKCKMEIVDTIDPYRFMTSEARLDCTCTYDSTLATFSVFEYYNTAGAAHGFYSNRHLTVDLTSGKAIHLADLVADTTLLLDAIFYAIRDLKANRDVRECLFADLSDTNWLPMPDDFFISSLEPHEYDGYLPSGNVSQRNGIVVAYDLYHIAPYGCGIPSIVLPIYWLSKHVPLTPYAKQLFGPGSYLSE